MITSMTDSGTTRDHTKDLARIIGCLSVIVGHVALAYAPQLPTDMLWPIRDSADSGWLIGLFYHARFIGVGIFMFLAGELTRRSLEHKSASQFLRDRTRRIGQLILIGLVTTLPLTYFIWAADAVDRDYIKWEQFFDFRLSDTDKSMLLGPAHLWFLEYLLMISIVAALITKLLGRAALTPRRHAIPVLIVVMFACAWFDPTMMTGFRNSFIPRPSFLVFNACIFAAGWFTAGPFRFPVLAVTLSLALCFMRPHHASESRFFIAWCATLCIPAIAAVSALCHRINTNASIIRRLSGMTLAIYITHLPIVCAMQYALKSTPFNVLVKFGVATCSTIFLSLACAVLSEHIASRISATKP